ncbi:DUF6468 domain-containing protein [Roseiterribacter gracilis]|uniref:DUF6468 domain-containing protein n=1 Tax=Roseiterribacter gracilis TaxID=2812848 RepID=A0A8S8XHU9_9PROT|nr:hypothetical protein TMPK1_37360 [Rhodospirillales bacterium TMPK1]
MSTTLLVLLDLCLAGLVIPLLIQMMRANRALAIVRDGKAEFSQLVGSLAEAVAKADISINTLKASAAEYDGTLQKQIGTARALVDELQMINESANNLASRLERATDASRGMMQPTQIIAEAPAPAPQPMPQPAPQHQHQQAAPAPRAVPRAASTVPARGGRSPEPIRIEPTLEEEAPRELKARSAAERELYEAIELLRRGS